MAEAGDDRMALTLLQGGPFMGHRVIIAQKERERAGMLKLAREMVVAVEQRHRRLSPGEDAMIIEILKKARTLEDEIDRLQKDRRRLNPSKHLIAGGSADSM
jgi:hypothetical protein